MFLDLEGQVEEIRKTHPQFQADAAKALQAIHDDYQDWCQSGQPSLDLWDIYKGVRDQEARQPGSSPNFCRRLLKEHGLLPPGVSVDASPRRRLTQRT